MAAATKISGNSGIFWMNGASEDEQPVVFVPGVDGAVKTQPSFSLGPNISSACRKSDTKMTARRSSDFKNGKTLKTAGKKQGHLQRECSGVVLKEKVPVHHPATVASEQIPRTASGAFLSSTQIMSEKGTTKSLVCLKDLCPEDKRRIANLIEELARVSEEKEVSVQRLREEQDTFERKIQQLEQQNLIIAQERESLQQQYRECQELLKLYQQYLSQQQAKLNLSIAQLSQTQADNKVLSREEAPSRANGSLFDGSYLGLAAARAQQPQVSKSTEGGKGEVQILSNTDSLSCVSEFSPTDEPIRQQRSQKRPCREPHLRCEHCQHSSYRTQPGSAHNDYCLGNDHHQNLNQNESHSGIAISSEAKKALARPQLGHEDWEEKRHQLLLQKMQLEMERERLHARLAEQEERLQRQNQQLHQSRLDYSRFQQATKLNLNSSTSIHDSQAAGPSHKDLSSSVGEEAEVQPDGQGLHEKPLKSLENGKEAKKDMATSPVKSPVSLCKPTPVAVIQKTPEDRLDFSVVELLDIFSPVSAHERNELLTRRPKTSQRKPDLAAPKPMGRTLRTPAVPYTQHAQQDLEESQILEDIFFIC